MGWRDLPYWLRGGLIGVLVIILYFVLMSSNVMSPYIKDLIVRFFTIIFYPFIILIKPVINLIKPSQISAVYLLFIILPISIFIGSIVYSMIIGYIIGKIKSRGQTPTSKQ